MNLTEAQLVAINCALYVGIAVLTPIAAVYCECAQYHYWPDLPSVMAALFTGLVAGLVAVRAFLDGSNERLKQKRNGGGR